MCTSKLWRLGFGLYHQYVFSGCDLLILLLFMKGFGFVLSFEEFFGDLNGYLRNLNYLTCEDKGCYHLEVVLVPLDSDVDGSQKNLCCFVIDMADPEFDNIETFE